MIREVTIALLALGLLGATMPELALANDPAPNTKDGKVRARDKKSMKRVNTKGGAGMGAMSPGGSSMGRSNPRANPNNDENGPRSSESSTDATSSQGTSSPR